MDSFGKESSRRTNQAQALKRLERVGAAYGVSPHWLLRETNDLFGRIDFTGMRVLDIGAGQGVHACTIASMGAHEVIAIEPELDGSRQGVSQRFQERLSQLSLTNVQFQPVSLESFQGDTESFDYILMHAVINHLDEAHVKDLHVSRESRDRYIQLLAPVLDMLAVGGTLVITDAARHNLLYWLIDSNILKQHPLNRSIQWDKHQNPPTWEALLLEVGFSQISHHPATYSQYPLVNALYRVPPVAFILGPHFVIRAMR